MKQLPIPLKDAVAIGCLAALGLGVALVASPGWALIVVSVLVLVYIILPDQKPGGPTP
jgi:hypothetical protein